MKFRNNKTGNIYEMLYEALDCTNSRDGTPVVVYSPLNNLNLHYVRERSEFLVKFTKLD